MMRTTREGVAPLVVADGYGAGVASKPTITGVRLRIANPAAGEAVAAGAWILAVMVGDEWVGLLPAG